MATLTDCRNITRDQIAYLIMSNLPYKPKLDTDVNRSIFFHLHSGRSMKDVEALFGVSEAHCRKVVDFYVWYLSLDIESKQVFLLNDDIKVYKAFMESNLKTLDDIVTHYKVYENFGRVKGLGKKFEAEILKRLKGFGYQIDLYAVSKLGLYVIQHSKSGLFLSTNNTWGTLENANIFKGWGKAKDFTNKFSCKDVSIREVKIKLI